MTEEKLTIRIRGIIHITNSILFKDPSSSQLFKGQIMCVRGQVIHPWSPTLPVAEPGFEPSLADSSVPYIGL